MKSVIVIIVLSLFTPISLLGAKPYKITEEDKAFQKAKEENKAVAYVFG